MKKIPEGQLNLFDFLNTSFEEASPDIQAPRLPLEEKHVFRVQKGEVREYIVTNEKWNCIWDQNLNDDVFKTMDAAKKSSYSIFKRKGLYFS